ncbi:MAG: tol-pal system YbgF family protein [Saprospiraceae bacterium]
MRVTVIISFLFVALSFVACKKTDYAAEVKRLEAAVASDPKAENSAALIKAYQDFVQNTPNDPQNRAYLSKVADLEVKAGNIDAAVKALSQSIKSNFDAEKSKTQVLQLASILGEKKDAKAAAPSFLAAFSDPAQLKTMGPQLIATSRTKSFDTTTQRLDKAAAANYVNVTELYAHAFPKEASNAEQLFKVAEIANILGKHDRALAIYNTILADYPNYEKMPQAMFLKGYTLDTHMKKFNDAKLAYEAFLAKYPEDNFAESTKFLIKNLGKPDAEIIEGFTKQGKK